MHPSFAGALINSALYLVCVFVAGLVTDHKFAWRCAVVAFGITYISHVLQFTAAQNQNENEHRIANYIVMLSIGLGVFAGLALLF